MIRKQQQYEQNLKLQLNHLDEILIAQNQIKKFMHDFSNYAIGLQSYIDKQDCDGASAYMKNLTQLYNINKSIIEIYLRTLLNEIPLINSYKLYT